MRIYLYLAVVLYCRACKSDKIWPEAESLVGIWPLDKDSELVNIASGASLVVDILFTAEPVKNSEVTGPFGQEETSYSLGEPDGSFIGIELGAGLFENFTMSFFLYMPVEEEGPKQAGLLTFATVDTSAKNASEKTKLPLKMVPLSPRKNGTKRAAKMRQESPEMSIPFSIGYTYPNDLQLYVDNQPIKPFTVLAPNTWNFITITYDSSLGEINVYDKDGNTFGTESASITVDEQAALILGYAVLDDPSTGYTMQPNDALACFVYYKTVLTPEQISQLPYHCQTRGDGTTTTTTVAMPIIKPWPQAKEGLLAFWPITKTYGFHDVSGNKLHDRVTEVPSTTTFGPFGDTDWVPKVGKNGSLFQVQNDKLALETSFTVSMFFKIGEGNNAGGLFQFLPAENTTDKQKKPFQFRYNYPTRTVDVSAMNKLVASVKVIQSREVWTFVAFVFQGEEDDEDGAILTAYGRHGPISHKRSSNIATAIAYSNNGIIAGRASKWGLSLNAGDAISCLMVYGKALLPDEIKQAYDACRIIQGSAPCGSPKPDNIPLIPAPTALLSGQVPYAALLRDRSNHSCSATIIDPFWLLTGSQCFAKPRIWSDFRAFVGFSKNDASDALVLDIVNVTTSGNASSSPREIALVQLKSAIDFTNPNINDACYEGRSDLGKAQYLFGFGKNGRGGWPDDSSFRFVAGVTQPHNMCLQSLGPSYNSSQDFCFAGTPENNNDNEKMPCEGDEGAPILVKLFADPTIGTKDRLTQVGVFYKRESGCPAAKPGIFAQLGQYKNWIAQVIATGVYP